MRHLSIVGAGSVGTAIAFAALNKGLADHFSLYDLDHDKVRAEVLDLRHGLEFVGPATIEGAADVAVCSDADVIVITAGAKQRPGESRLELTTRNSAIFADMIPKLVEVAPEAVLLVVTNPVDVLTALTIRYSGHEDGRVFGSGTVLDSSRLRHILAQRFAIAERHVHAHVVGEHGDTETVLWSSATIGGAPLIEMKTSEGRPLDESDRDEILAQVRNSAYEIIEGKGATSWAIALAVTQILGALDVSGHSAVLPVTAPTDPDLGFDGVCISLPRLVDAAGVGEVLPFSATDEEMSAIRASAQAVREAIDALG
ncbi:MAG TPA: L-lactate dehydrogenase [Acidimicrobiia bacterium]|nr:L-lactate dehydrogenase [Acidimicrobiia bacterium]